MWMNAVCKTFVNHILWMDLWNFVDLYRFVMICVGHVAPTHVPFRSSPIGRLWTGGSSTPLKGGWCSGDPVTRRMRDRMAWLCTSLQHSTEWYNENPQNSLCLLRWLDQSCDAVAGQRVHRRDWKHGQGAESQGESFLKDDESNNSNNSNNLDRVLMELMELMELWSKPHRNTFDWKILKVRRRQSSIASRALRERDQALGHLHHSSSFYIHPRCVFSHSFITVWP